MHLACTLHVNMQHTLLLLNKVRNEMQFEDRHHSNNNINNSLRTIEEPPRYVCVIHLLGIECLQVGMVWIELRMKKVK